MPRACLQFVLVVFHDHTNLLFLKMSLLFWQRMELSDLEFVFSCLYVWLVDFVALLRLPRFTLASVLVMISVTVPA